MKLKALKPLRYGRALVPAGAEFDAARRHARVLLAVGRAEAVRTEAPRLRPVAEAARAALDKPKRTYKRRDLVAEASTMPVQASASALELEPAPERAAGSMGAVDDITETDAS